MKIPLGYTETQILEAIDKVVNMLAPSFTFGYYDVEDIKQQGRLFAIQLLETGKFDATRPFENYAFRHIRNRYLNMRRDLLRRNEPPCRQCAAGTPCGPGNAFCPRYQGWLERNQAKSNLMRPLDLNYIADEHESRTRCPSTVAEDVATSELVQRIDKDLPVELRGTFLQMRAGVSVPKSRRLQVEAAVKAILKGALDDKVD